MYTIWLIFVNASSIRQFFWVPIVEVKGFPLPAAISDDVTSAPVAQKILQYAHEAEVSSSKLVVGSGNPLHLLNGE